MLLKENNNKKLAELLRRAQSGDRNSLQVLCKELEGYIRGYFRTKFKNNAIVDDLCQETYFRFLKNILLIRDKMKLKSFVAKVALHVMQDYFRQKYRIKENGLENSYGIDEDRETKLKMEVMEQITNDYDDQTILSKIDLHRALNQLSEKSRNIILLKTKGLNYNEISLETGLTVSGVKMQIKRSIEQLRVILFLVTFYFINSTL